MSRYQITPQLKQIIESSSLDKSIKQKLFDAGTISHSNLIGFYKSCRPTPSLKALVQTTKVHVPEKAAPQKSPEFESLMTKLRLEQKEKEYQRLINPSPAIETLYEQNPQDIMTPAQAHKELKNQITTIVNILISVGSVVYAIWYWTASLWGLQDSYRVLLCLFFGILVLVAEVVVYLGYLNKIEEAKTRERQKKEVKKIISSEVIL